MRNLNPLRDDSHTFATNIIKETSTSLQPGYTTILNNIRGRLKDYDDLFKNDDLQNVSPSSMSETDGNRFRKLYKAERNEIQRLKSTVLRNGHGIYDDICPICGIGPANTIDHFIPEQQFPEYCVHPRNLIPSCIDCNNPKREMYRTDANERAFWNNYIDKMPDRQFLFCNVLSKDGIPYPDYYIRNVNGIKASTYAIIERTFNRMHIIERYNSAASGRAYSFILQLAKHKIFAQADIQNYLNEEVTMSLPNDYVMVYLSAMLNNTVAIAWIVNEVTHLHGRVNP